MHFKLHVKQRERVQVAKILTLGASEKVWVSARASNLTISSSEIDDLACEPWSSCPPILIRKIQNLWNSVSGSEDNLCVTQQQLPQHTPNANVLVEIDLHAFLFSSNNWHSAVLKILFCFLQTTKKSETIAITVKKIDINDMNPYQISSLKQQLDNVSGVKRSLNN